ncbi:MAG: hypothetical protein M0R03_10345 [Novosphingobium sp.]|nr:hypothetical protein [Novosphingobium sp.]
MLKYARRAVLGVVLAASALAVANPVQARDGYRRDGGNDAAIAIGAGIVGLAIGAMIADRDDDRYYDRRYYRDRRYVSVRGYPDYYYYYPGNPNRYYRDRYYTQHYQPYYRSYRSNGRWDGSYYGNRRSGAYASGARYKYRDRDHRRSYRRGR